MSVNRPSPFKFVWAESGETWDLPESGADHNDGRADIQTGFPKKTMISVIKGGVPPYGRDHNTILNRITKDLQWMQAGGFPVFDQALCDKIGGYPYGAIVATVEQNAWVYWINLEDGNIQDPVILDVSKLGVQKGWRRYPVIEDKDGATLKYNSAGELMIFTATSQYQLYVSWTNGKDWDEEYGGSRTKPFKTIDRALSVAPDVGNITIYILDTDTHPWIGMYDYNIDTGISNLYDLPGTMYMETNKLTVAPTELSTGLVSIGSKTVNIIPYQDVEKDEDDQWFKLIRDVQYAVNDGSWAFCVEQTDLDRFGLKRPKILLCWEYGNTKPEDYWVSTYVKWAGLARGTNSGSIRFNAVDFEINRLDLLNDTKLSNNIGWCQVSYDITFVGCKVGEQCKTGLNFMFGGSGNAECRLTFGGANQFKDLSNINNLKNMKTIQASGLCYITSSFDNPAGWYLTYLDLHMMTSNIEEYFSHKSVYKDPSLKIIETPFERYAFMNATFAIDKE